MSVCRCDWCDSFIDTDYNVEGAFEKDAPFRYKCGRCLEENDERQSDSGYIEPMPEGEK